MSFQSQCSRAGSCSYASINCHIGIRLSRRDDLESLMYMIVFLIRGALPWQTKTKANDNRKWQVVFAQKRAILDEELFNGCPKQLQQIFAYVKSLKFDEKPNYTYIRDMIQIIKSEFSLRSKMFDWQVLERRHKSLDKRKTEEENTKILSKGKTTKKKTLKKNNRGLAMATLTSLPAQEDSHEVLRSQLPLPIGTSKTFLSGQDLSSNSSKGETVKNSFPEFIHRKHIFRELNKFRMLFTFSE